MIFWATNQIINLAAVQIFPTKEKVSRVIFFLLLSLITTHVKEAEGEMIFSPKNYLMNTNDFFRLKQNTQGCNYFLQDFRMNISHIFFPLDSFVISIE